MTERQCETANLTLQDWHYGKHTASYGPEITARRLTQLVDKLARIRDLMPGYAFDKLVLHVLGDMNDGTEIYAGQTHEQAISNVEAQANDLSILLESFLGRLADVWGSIEVEAVPGNHGRAGKFAHTAANWDMVCYRYLQLRQKRAQIRFNDWTEQDPFIRKTVIRGHTFLDYHGHDVRSYGNIPRYGVTLRLLRWYSSHMGPFDVVNMGHFHCLDFWKVNAVRVFLGGTAVSGDEWGLRTFGLESSCSTWLYGTSDKYPVTWQFAIDLT